MKRNAKRNRPATRGPTRRGGPRSGPALPSGPAAAPGPPGERGWPLAVLTRQALLRGLDIDDADTGLIVGQEPQALPPQLPAQVRRVPHERPTLAQVVPRPLPRPADH